MFPHWLLMAPPAGDRRTAPRLCCYQTVACQGTKISQGLVAGSVVGEGSAGCVALAGCVSLAGALAGNMTGRAYSPIPVRRCLAWKAA
jgi:hypothetical protein